MNTKKFGLIGFPLTHSFSEKYFAEKFKTEHINNCQYGNYEIENIAKFEQIKNDDSIAGINVTIPHKETVIPFLDALNEDAQKIGAVNTIVFKNGKTKGFNTDIYGFENSIAPFLKPHHQKALILGTGGASKAVRFVFEKLGIDYKFVSRTKKVDNFSYAELDETVLSAYTIIVNTTPLGTYPKENTYPNIPYKYISDKHLLFDLVYNPAKTLFLQKGEQQGASIKNGYQMLELQAEKSWEIWNDIL